MNSQSALPLLCLPENQARYYANRFGLAKHQVRKFEDLTDEQQKQVSWLFSLSNADVYIYAIKSDGGLVNSRINRNMLFERTQNE